MRDQLDMQWRFASDGDIPVVAELNHQLIADEGHRNPMGHEQLEQRMRSWLAREYRCALFLSQREVVAYVLFREDENARTHLRQFFVVRGARRRGLGRRAFGLFRREIAPRNKRIVLEVLSANTAAASFWRAMGFRDYAITLEMDLEQSDSEPSYG
jgi:ribosomal protein S18 acetylase RimI-like enzyme